MGFFDKLKDLAKDKALEALDGLKDKINESKEEQNADSYVEETEDLINEVEDEDEDVEYEDVEDTIAYGAKNFKLVDGNKQRYDFRLSAKSHAIGLADKETALPCDRLGTKRDDQPDAGAYEYVEEENSLTKTNL